MNPEDINGVRVNADEYDFDNLQFEPDEVITPEFIDQQKIKVKNLAAQHGGVVDVDVKLKFKDGFELGDEHELYDVFFAQYVEFVVNTSDCVIMSNDDLDAIRYYMSELAEYRKTFGELPQPIEQDYEGANYE